MTDTPFDSLFFAVPGKHKLFNYKEIQKVIWDGETSVNVFYKPVMQDKRRLCTVPLKSIFAKFR